MRKINIGVCQIRIEPSEFKGKDYHIFYLGRFYITCPTMRMAMAFVSDLNDEYEEKNSTSISKLAFNN